MATDPEPTGVTAAPGSPLWDLQAELADETADTSPVYTVPGWDPPVKVKLRPVEHGEVKETFDRWRGDKALTSSEQSIKGHAELLVRTCLAVYRELDGQLVSIDPHDLDGDPPAIDRRLAGLMGLSDDTVMTDVAVKLFRGRTARLVNLVDHHVAWSYSGGEPGNPLAGLL